MSCLHESDRQALTETKICRQTLITLTTVKLCPDCSGGSLTCYKQTYEQPNRLKCHNVS